MKHILFSLGFLIVFAISTKAQSPIGEHDIEEYEEHDSIGNHKKNWIAINTGLNRNITITNGDNIFPDDRQYATTMYSITVGRQIFTNTFLTLGYYSLYYEYGFKSSYGYGSFGVSFGNTSTRIPINIRYNIYNFNFKRTQFSLFIEGGVIFEFVEGRNNSLSVPPNLVVQENFNNGRYGLLNVGGGISVKLCNSVSLNLIGQKIWGFKQFMQKDFYVSNSVSSGNAFINGTGSNFTIGLQYHF